MTVVTPHAIVSGLDRAGENRRFTAQRSASRMLETPPSRPPPVVLTVLAAVFGDPGRDHVAEIGLPTRAASFMNQ